MLLVSIVPGLTLSRRATAAAMKRAPTGESMRNTSPGLVQNCPTPSVNDAQNSSASMSARLSNASGHSTLGFTLLISAYTGIGTGRSAAIRVSANPAVLEPATPTSLIPASATSPPPSSFDPPLSNENTPSGRTAALIAATMAEATSSDV